MGDGGVGNASGVDEAKAPDLTSRLPREWQKDTRPPFSGGTALYELVSNDGGNHAVPVQARVQSWKPLEFRCSP